MTAIQATAEFVFWPSMELTTPALLFPAISLLLLAFTNRFLALAALVRQLAASAVPRDKDARQAQIANLRRRIGLIRAMQALGVSSFMLCTLSMFALFLGEESIARALFGVSIILLATSLFFSLYEIGISTRALEIELKAMAGRDAGD